MFERDSTDVARSLSLGNATDILVFLGSILVFPNSILRIAEQEAGGVHAVRVDTLRDLLALARNRSFQVGKVFVDDQLAADILRDFDMLRSDLPGADWILAYRDKAVAQRLLRARAGSPQLAGILLLPMSLSICPWSAMLRLVLSGQFIAAGDLIDPAQEAGHMPEPDPAKGPGSGRRRSTARLRKGQEAGADMPPLAMGTAFPDPGLTRREKEVLAHVSQGGRNKTIAHKMSLSEHTVKLHLHNAITKIGARNRTEAATWYLSRQIGGGHEF